jgi:hypothetical protein
MIDEAFISDVIYSMSFLSLVYSLRHDFFMCSMLSIAINQFLYSFESWDSINKDSKLGRQFAFNKL